MNAKNDYKTLIRGGVLEDVIGELTAQGLERPTLRSCYYLLRDRGLLVETKKAYDKLDESLSKERDAGRFDYGLLAPEGGEDRRGLLPDELEETIVAMREQNVTPKLCGGVLKAVLVEKIGLVPYLEQVVGGGSPRWKLRRDASEGMGARLAAPTRNASQLPAGNRRSAGLPRGL